MSFLLISFLGSSFLLCSLGNYPIDKNGEGRLKLGVSHCVFYEVCPEEKGKKV